MSDTVIVYLHWGTELDACPNPLQEPLANALVAGGADIIVGTHAHVLLGGGYLGSAYVDYGLGNFAFYDNSPPEDASGSLVVTATGPEDRRRHLAPGGDRGRPPPAADRGRRRPALAAWTAARGCTDVTAAPSSALASPATEQAPATPAQVARLSVDSG